MNWNSFQWRSLKTRVTLFTLAIFLLSLWALAFYASQMLREQMQRLLSEQQFSTVSFLADAITHDVSERVQALETVAEGVTPAILENPAALQALLVQRPVLQRLFSGGTFATGTDGTVIASLPLALGRLGVNYMDRDHLIGALREGKTTIGRPVMGRQLRAPLVAMAVPIRDTRGTVIGALAGTTDLGQPSFLDRILEDRYRNIGNYRLVSPRHQLIVTGSDKSDIMKPLPASAPTATRMAQGHEGTDTATDPQGVAMLVSAKSIPVAGWFLVARLPIAEAFAPIRVLQQRMLLAAIFLTLLAGILAWWMVKRQLAPMLTAVETLTARSQSNQPPQPLPISRADEIGDLIGGFNRLLETLNEREIALRESEGRFRGLTEMSSDFYWESDAEHRLTQRSESKRDQGDAVFLKSSAIGKRRWEIPSLSPDEAGWREHRALLDACLPFRDFEISRPRADGTTYHFSVSGNPVFNAAGEFTGYRGVGTERHRAQAGRGKDQRAGLL